MNIPDEVIERETGVAMEDWEYPQQVRDIFKLGAAWAQQEDAALIKAEIERLELVRGTYSKAQRHALGVVWATLVGGDKA